VEGDMEEGDEGGLHDHGYTGDLLGYNANDPFVEECFQVPDDLDVSEELLQHGPFLSTRTSAYDDGVVIEIFPNYFLLIFFINLEIDEHSPDEDDRAAEAFLHQSEVPNNTEVS